MKTRPRIASGAPRCTKSALQTTAIPFPTPETMTQAAAIQTFGDSAAAPTPRASSPNPAPYTDASSRCSIQAPTLRLPTTRPRPALASSRPYPKSPASNETLASTTSPTFTPAFPTMATFQAMSTVRSARERTIIFRPAAMSCRCPSVTACAAWSSRAGMRRMRDADQRNVIALTTYAQSGLVAATRMPPASGPITVVSASAAWSIPCARGSSESSTRFGRLA